MLEKFQEPDAPYWTLRGNGGLHTTLGDMLAWHRALDTDAVLSKDARAKYFMPYVAEGPRGLSHYAYGWVVTKSARGTSVVQHNGGNGIYVAEFVRFPDEDAMLFVTSTDTTVTATSVVEVLERILFGGHAALPAARRRAAPIGCGPWRASGTCRREARCRWPPPARLCRSGLRARTRTLPSQPLRPRRRRTS